MKVQFKGIPSGDYESFCWDVTKEEFIKIKGREPDEFDPAYFNEGFYRVYPDDIFQDSTNLQEIIIESKLLKN
jgi:hypothetical protein